MKQTNYLKQTIYLLILCCFSCTSTDINNRKNDLDTSLANKIHADKETKYIQLSKLSITGDFDGDGETDTLLQNTINKISNAQIDSFPNNQWDSLENYFYKINTEVVLTITNRQDDTLHLGHGASLYCLINLGDNNNDKKDEIAFVVDDYNFTNISPCYIYTLCSNKWTELKSFKIHENAFEFEGDSAKTFKQINGFLEYRKNKWFYIDYYDWYKAESNKDTVLQPLKIKNGC